MKLPELKAALEKLQSDRPDLFKGVLVVSYFEKITNVPGFIDSHINSLEANPGNRTFLPFYDRLVRLYEILTENAKAVS